MARIHLVLLCYPSSSDSCMSQILKFAIDVAGINPCFVSSNLTSKAAHKLSTIFFQSASCNPLPSVILYVFHVVALAEGV